MERTGNNRGKSKFAPGMKVRIVQGPFAGLEGIIVSTEPSRELVRVAVNIFDQERTMDFDALQVEELTG
jgi:transcription antitermination factor NusG